MGYRPEKTIGLGLRNAAAVGLHPVQAGHGVTDS